MNLPRLTYDQSKRAYDLGFRANTEWWFPLERITNQPIHCLSHYGVTEDLFANPENALFLFWCRKEKGVVGGLTQMIGGWYSCSVGKRWYSADFETYEEAETALIDYLLDFLEKKTK